MWVMAKASTILNKFILLSKSEQHYFKQFQDVLNLIKFPLEGIIPMFILSFGWNLTLIYALWSHNSIFYLFFPFGTNVSPYVFLPFFPRYGHYALGIKPHAFFNLEDNWKFVFTSAAWWICCTWGSMLRVRQ